MKVGLVQVYTGNGKGKTTSALGLAMRAVGHGFKVIMIQFMKGRVNYGELESARRLGIEIVQFGRPTFVNKENPDPIDVEEAHKALSFAKEVLKKGDYDMVILDEINVALDFNLIPLKDLLELIDSKPDSVELVLTGRYAHSKVIERADLVSEVIEVKHPYMKGVEARKGIEY